MGHVGGVLSIGNGAALGQVNAKRFGHIGLAAGKTGGNQHQVALDGKFFAGGHHGAAAGGFIHHFAFQLGNQRTANLTGFVLIELFDRGLVNARVATKHGNGFLLAVIGFQHLGPFGPGVGGGAFCGRAGHHFQLGHACAALADGGADTVVAGIAAADDQHLFVLGTHGLAIGKAGIQQAAGHAGQVIHGKVDPLCIAPRGVDVTRLLGTAGQHNGIVCIQHILGRGAAANIGAGYKVNALGLHNVHAAVNDLLFQLHVGDAVHQQAAHAVLTLVHGHFVAALVQVIGNCKAGRAGTYHGNGFAGAGRGRAGGQQAGFIAIFYNGVLVLLHGNRAAGGVAAGAGSFAQSGAYSAGKLREAVGGAQAMYSQIPLALVDKVVPFGD